MKPAGWPRYLIEKRLKSGGIAYYWNPPSRDIKAGFTINREALGTDYSAAVARAHELNAYLDAWRSGRGATKDLDHQPGCGTLRWLVERYKRSRAWEKVSPRSRPDYEWIFSLVLDYPLKSGATLGDAPVASITPRGVDRLYIALQAGKRKTGLRRIRQANLCMIRMARAWDVVHRLYPKVVPAENPFRGVELDYSRGTTRPASREEAFALHRALIAAGEPYLAVVPLVCFEWLQRPENVIAGYLTWTDYRPPDQPNSVIIEHHKTGERVSLPLSDKEGPLFPELTEYLDNLPRLGVPIVLMQPRRKARGNEQPPRPFKLRDARARVRKAALKAGLPADLTLAACRHGGMTELGDADLTEQGIMSLSGHKTPEASRIYVKRTEAQRLAAARRRRAYVESERTGTKSQNRAAAAESE